MSKNTKGDKRYHRSKGSVMIEMAVLSAIIAIGAVAATRNLGERVRDAYCRVAGAVISAQDNTNFVSTEWSWQDGKPAGCRRSIGW